MDRIVGTFDIFNRSGIWEMSGQLFILCATINIALNITDGKKTTKRNWKKIKLSNQEIILFCLGLLLMITGAIIESYKIINIVQQN